MPDDGLVLLWLMSGLRVEPQDYIMDLQEDVGLDSVGVKSAEAVAVTKDFKPIEDWCLADAVMNGERWIGASQDDGNYSQDWMGVRKAIKMEPDERKASYMEDVSSSAQVGDWNPDLLVLTSEVLANVDKSGIGARTVGLSFNMDMEEALHGHGEGKLQLRGIHGISLWELHLNLLH